MLCKYWMLSDFMKINSFFDICIKNFVEQILHLIVTVNNYLSSCCLHCLPVTEVFCLICKFLVLHFDCPVRIDFFLSIDVQKGNDILSI